jgi:hypothetical protein
MEATIVPQTKKYLYMQCNIFSNPQHEKAIYSASTLTQRVQGQYETTQARSYRDYHR